MWHVPYRTNRQTSWHTLLHTQKTSCTNFPPHPLQKINQQFCHTTRIFPFILHFIIVNKKIKIKLKTNKDLYSIRINIFSCILIKSICLSENDFAICDKYINVNCQMIRVMITISQALKFFL